MFLLPDGSWPVIHSVSLKLVIVKTKHNKNDKVPRFDFISVIRSVRCLFFGNNVLLSIKTFAFSYSQGFLITYLNELHLHVIVLSYSSVFVLMTRMT